MHTNSTLFPPYLQAVCPEDEHAYRSAFLCRDVRTFTVLISLGLLINLVLVRSDFLFLNNRPLLPWILGLRLLFVLFSLFTLAAIQRLNNPCLFDRWVLAWSAGCVSFVLLINLSRPATYTGNIALDLCLVIVLYILQPGPSLWRLLPPLVLSLGNLLLLLTMKTGQSSMTLMTPITAYVAVNAVGWQISNNWYRYRKSSFMAHRALEQLYRDSERRRREAEVSEKTWERIIDTSPNLLVVINEEQRITRVNKTFADRFGITKEAAIGRKCCELLCGFAQPPLHCPHHNICKIGTPRSLETYFPVLGVDVRLVSAPLIDQGGDGTAMVILIRDISDWKQTAQALKTAREQYRSLVENSHGIIYTITPQGYLTYASPSYSKLLGYDPEHVVGKHFSEIVHPEDVERCEAFQKELLESGEVRHGLEYRIFHKNGSMRWHLSNFIPRLNDQGQVESFVGNAMDISVQKLHQAELKAAREEAEEASRVKSDFLALVSHEIRTPLNAIVGFSGLARRTLDPVQLREYIDILDQSAHLLMDLVNDVLDMSKVEAGQLTIDSIAFNLPETLELLHWQFNPVAEKKTEVDFRMHLGPNLPTWILGDPTRLRQVLSNLLSNALKFTEAGTVTLQVEAETTDEGSAPSRLLFLVEDTGIGIDPTKQELLFQPFQQIEPGITRKYGGTGLGLTIVRRLVELMDGRIQVRSRLGQGSCFTVELPCRPCLQPEYKQIEARPQTPLSVLVVEDNSFNRLLLQETLREWGHVVSSVDNAVAALNLVNERRFDCIILDLWMPGLDGLELSARLRMLESLSQLEPTPIIAYTADTDDRTRRLALEAGIQAVLCKPLDPRQLRLILDEHCRVSCHPPAVGTGPESTADPVIDPANACLDPLVIADMGPDQERIATYVHLLWGDIETELNRLDQALLVEDRQRILEASHSLKGLCGYLEDKRAAGLALRLHQGAMELAFLELNDLVRQLHHVALRPLLTTRNTP